MSSTAQMAEFEKELVGVLNSKKEMIENIRKTIKDKDIIVLFGVTGSGKSTTSNLMRDIPLMATENGYVLAGNSISACPIGIGSTSQTLVPNIFEYNGHMLVDLPGLMDTRGKAASALVATFIKKIFIEAKSLKIIFVESLANMSSARGQIFKKNLEVFKRLLPDLTDLKSCSLMVVTGTDFCSPGRVLNSMKTVLDSSIFSELQNTIGISLETLVPFQSAKKFIEEDEYQNFKTTLKMAEMQKNLEFTKKKLEDLTKTIKGFKIPKINSSVLLNPGTTELIQKLIESYFQKSLSQVKSQVRLEQLTKEQLQALDCEIHAKVNEMFERSMVENETSRQVFEFVREFDEEMFEIHKKRAMESVNVYIENFKLDIKNRIKTIETNEAIAQKEEEMEKKEEAERREKEARDNAQNEKVRREQTERDLSNAKDNTNREIEERKKTEQEKKEWQAKYDALMLEKNKSGSEQQNQGLLNSFVSGIGQGFTQGAISQAIESFGKSFLGNSKPPTPVKSTQVNPTKKQENIEYQEQWG